ncbi:MAG: response regulator [Candidatus Limnocylindrales bacterium]
MAATILLVDDDPATQRTVTYLLSQEGYDVVVARTGAEGLKRWSTDRPDLILLAVALPKMGGYEVTARIRAGEAVSKAHVPIILLSDRADLRQRVLGLRAGADDDQGKPFHPAELLARIKGLLARYAPKLQDTGVGSLGRTYAFYGARGGVGTTTLAINTAIALQRALHRRVVLVDGNLQFGDHRVFLDLDLERKSIVDAVSATTIDRDLLRGVVAHHESGIDVLLAPPTPEAAELISTDQRHLIRIIETLKTMYDYVLIDIDKRLDETNLDVITAADSLYVVMTADLSSLKNVRLVLETMASLGVVREKIHLVLNRDGAQTGINVSKAEGALKRKVEFQIPNDYRTAVSAFNSGAPFMLSQPTSRLGRAIVSFARELDRQAARTGAVPLLAARAAS